MFDQTPLRRERLAETLPGDDVEAMLVSSVTNVGYLTGFTGDSSALLVQNDRAILISDGRYTTQLDQECPDVEAHIRPVGQPLMEGIAEVVGRLGLRRLAFESPVLTVAEFETLNDALPTVQWHGLTGRVETLRLIKDESEIEAIRAAVDYAERAFTMLRSGLRLDETEKDATDLLEGYLRRCGAESSSFPPIVAVGSHAALPHYRGTAGTRLGDDDFVLIDWGADGGPYKSDLTRVVVTGKVTAKFAEIYRAVLTAQALGIAAIRPGVKACDVDAEARASLEDAGFGSLFSHGLGHGVGREIHEAPLLRKGCDIVLQPGMIVTVEPGVYLPDWGGVRIEDDVLVTPDGCEVLTRVPKTLDAIRMW
ncbi:MAG: Xaa-Pro peptidase family protein [Isosphaeraceae bacterium]